MNQVWFLILFFAILVVFYHYCPKMTLFLLEPQPTFTIQIKDQPSIDLNSIVQRIKIPEKVPLLLKKLYKKHRSASPGFIYIMKILLGITRLEGQEQTLV
jgi:hypothetical protein